MKMTKANSRRAITTNPSDTIRYKPSAFNSEADGLCDYKNYMFIKSYRLYKRNSFYHIVSLPLYFSEISYHLVNEKVN